jgi:hypothetical protein
MEPAQPTRRTSAIPMGKINIHKIDLSTQTIAECQNLDAAIQ